ncbi:alpha/beta fold hydrolase [Lederbergia citrea]|uniref:Alpha/beta hydrolase n=1 Tax=Lederbergia citrea TaxID=2833581 RepID=A0A942UT70_9BACI|nr:alpha/beta fold hydrolase [Lederbergia citrea]MBS4177967.1 alpha/beta hydrolase [Lederbergia citrea]MBS4204634.1 alpha/beta hydrolase [Lederbergia citrea]MBS4223519.1 alpha/beta hydrolase [Lederbergia citrea]
MRKKYRGIGLFFIVAIIIGLVFFRPKMLEGKKTAAELNDAVPTVFVHGYKGSERSFSTMLERLKSDQLGTTTMVVHVRKNGRISMKGSVPKDVHNPFIQVIFENNRAQISDQTMWLKKLMKILKEQHGIQQVNLVGHSMGGLAWTSYLESVSGNTDYPIAIKLVTIGSPFKGIDREDYFKQNYGAALIDLKPTSAALKKLVENKGSFPDRLPVLSIAGVINDPVTGDGLVSQYSALGNRDIIPPSQFTEIVMNDTEATHSGLHEHKGVDKLIAEFLWGNE